MDYYFVLSLNFEVGEIHELSLLNRQVKSKLIFINIMN